MSGERNSNKTAETVASVNEALQKLCAVAFLNYATQLQKIDDNTAMELIAAKKNEKDANEEIDSIIKEKIIANSPGISPKEMTDIKSQLRHLITNKKLKDLQLSVQEQGLLDQFKFDDQTFDAIKMQVDILADANKMLFASPMAVPKPSDESRAARQMLLSHITLEILNCPNEQGKTDRIEHWIKVLDGMLNQGNYYGAHVVMSALNDYKINTKNVDEDMQGKLSSAVNLFANTKEAKAQLAQAMKVQFDDGLTVIPSLHSIEGSLVGCLEGVHGNLWNSIIDSITPYQEQVAANGTYKNQDKFAQDLINGDVAPEVKMQQVMDARTLVTTVEVDINARRTRFRSENFTDVMAVRSNLSIVLEKMQAYVNSHENGDQHEIVKERVNIFRELLATVKNGTDTIQKILDMKERAKIADAISVALQNPAIVNHINKANKGETQTQQLLSELNSVFGVLNRKSVELKEYAPLHVEAKKQPAPNSQSNLFFKQKVNDLRDQHHQNAKERKDKLINNFNQLIDKLPMTNDAKDDVKRRFEHEVAEMRSVKLFSSTPKPDQGMALNPLMKVRPLSEQAKERRAADAVRLRAAFAIMQSAQSVIQEDPAAQKQYDIVAAELNRAAKRIHVDLTSAPAELIATSTVVLADPSPDQLSRKAPKDKEEVDNYVSPGSDYIVPDAAPVPVVDLDAVLTLAKAARENFKPQDANSVTPAEAEMMHHLNIVIIGILDEKYNLSLNRWNENPPEGKTKREIQNTEDQIQRDIKREILTYENENRILLVLLTADSLGKIVDNNILLAASTDVIKKPELMMQIKAQTDRALVLIGTQNKLNAESKMQQPKDTYDNFQRPTLKKRWENFKGLFKKPDGSYDKVKILKFSLFATAVVVAIGGFIAGAVMTGGGLAAAGAVGVGALVATTGSIAGGATMLGAVALGVIGAVGAQRQIHDPGKNIKLATYKINDYLNDANNSQLSTVIIATTTDKEHVHQTLRGNKSAHIDRRSVSKQSAEPSGMIEEPITNTKKDDVISQRNNPRK
jgi:hypothetical protein